MRKSPVACQHERNWEEQSGGRGDADVFVLEHTEKTLHMEAYSICKYLCCGADMSPMGDLNVSNLFCSTWQPVCLLCPLKWLV